MSKKQDYGRTKYHRVIWSAIQPDAAVTADVYSVLEAFAVTCPARQHAIKKLLCAGLRGKADELTDLNEAAVALGRSIQMATAKARR